MYAESIPRKSVPRKKTNKVQQNKYGNKVSRQRRALEISGLDYPWRQRPIPDKWNPQNNRTNTYTLNAWNKQAISAFRSTLLAYKGPPSIKIGI